MKVLVIGGGGREHALAWKLSQSTLCNRVIACPGNPGMAAVAECVPATEAGPAGYLAVAEASGADLTVTGPEAPLVAGVADLFLAHGKAIVGPTAAAARIEGSKAFAKEIMQRAGAPTARSITAEDAESAARAIDAFGFPAVIKADGLAAGKGVVIAGDKQSALSALEGLPRGRFVIEEFLEGEEVSFIVYTDGRRVFPLAPTQDHKRIGDGDTGPNTGGMGAYRDARILSEAATREILDRIISPTLEAMREAGHPFTGFLYAGLMMTAAGPKVLEFNARLGDPETQPLLHGLESDLLALFTDGEPPRWREGASACVVMAAHGYPGAVRTGDVISGIEDCGATVFHAGTRLGARGLETAGGRVLGVTASGATLSEAIEGAYAGVAKIRFDGMQYRKDIGAKGLRRW
jgi:phosphoribosylamine--glycine ligase